MDAEPAAYPALDDLSDFADRVDSCNRLGRRLGEAAAAFCRVKYRPELLDAAGPGRPRRRGQPPAGAGQS